MDRRKSDRRANERRSDERRHHDRRSSSGEVARERRQRRTGGINRPAPNRSRNQDRREHDRRKINLLLNPEAQELLTKTPWMEELLVKCGRSDKFC